MLIKNKKIADLKPAPYNPRKSSEKQEENLKASLEKFGVVEPVIFNKQTGHIVGGHFRVRELEKLGIKTVDCVIVDLSLEDEKELNIRLNANLGSWDWDSISNGDWDKETLAEWGLETFDLAEINSDDFFEDDFNDDKNEKTNIVLEYSAEDFDKVTAAFDAIDGSKEDIVWNFLGLQ